VSPIAEKHSCIVIRWSLSQAFVNKRKSIFSAWIYLLKQPHSQIKIVYMRISSLKLIRRCLLGSLILTISLFSPAEADIPLVINELMASNSNCVQDPQDQYDDWIEIYNYGPNDIDMTGMYLTDDLSVPAKWRFPDATTIHADDFLLIWADNDTSDDGLHANFKLNADGEEVGLVGRDGLTLIDSIVFPDQFTDKSYGRYRDANETWCFFDSPSPAAQNEGGYLGQVAEPTISHNRGFYDAPFSVTITTETEDAEIYYSLEGSVPGEYYGRAPRGALYTGPVLISRTTCLRARAYKDGWKTSKVNTQTYIFVDDVITQSQEQAITADYPRSWGDNYPADYEMDYEIYNDPAYSGQMADAMLSIPTLSIVTNKEYLFGQTQGIYTHSLSEGENWEKPISAELFCPDGSKEFQINCGMRIQGGHSRHPYKCPKHSFSLRFRNIYGPAKLNYPLFGDDWPVDSFDTLQLRGFFNNAWTHGTPSQRERAQYLRDPWMRISLTEMGNPDALQGFFVHLYLNGFYWGIYHLHERPDNDHYTAYNGGEVDKIDAINGDPTYVIGDHLNSGSVSDGTIDAWLELKDVVASRNWEQICKLIDMDNFLDWTILIYFAGTTDIKYGTNWRAAGGGEQRKPWRFYCWDAEHVMEYVDQFWIGQVDDPSGLLESLVEIEEFRVRFGDRIHKHLFNNGALSSERNIERWVKLSDEVRLAVIAESARWGDYRRDVHSWQYEPYYLYTVNEFWVPENNYIIDYYFPNRNEYALDMFRMYGVYPFVDAPVFNINGSYQHGGRVANNSLLSMSLTDNAGTIYYTLDGNDPRLEGGAISSAAVDYSVTGPVTLDKSTTVKARTLIGTNQWSALNKTVFAVGPMAENLRITEIMYHPQSPAGQDDPNEEFIELKNIGTEKINLNFVRFTNGIDFTFPSIELAPCEYIVVVQDRNAFETQYGIDINIAGQYTGQLANNGERIRLENAIEQTILDFQYKDNWYDSTDGQGLSLTIREPANPDTQSWDSKNAWRASNFFGGSPGRDDNIQ
jgi:hypothetical protein